MLRNSAYIQFYRSMSNKILLKHIVRPMSSKFTYEEMLLKNPLALPRLPIPALSSTIERWLESIKPLVIDSPKEWERIKKVAHDFELGEGHDLHKRLIEKEAADAAKGDEQFPHSYIESCWNDMYLEGRWSLPINSNPYIGLQPPPSGHVPLSHDPQISTAAGFIYSHLKYLRTIKSGTYEPDDNICVHQHPLQVGTGRISRRKRDRVITYPDSRHIVVISKNRAYEVQVLSTLNQDGSQTQISALSLVKIFEEIKKRASSAGPPDSFVGYLTAVDRDTWADIRDVLESSGSENLKSLKIMDSALCVVALEDKPENKDNTFSTSAASIFLTGYNGENRWFDKHQLCVLPSGAAAVNYEHSYSDGMAWCRNLGEVWHDMYKFDSKSVRKLPEYDSHEHCPPIEELQWKLSPVVKRAIAESKSTIENDCKNLGVNFLNFEDFGKECFKEWKLMPDAAVQMSIQAAFYSIHNRQPVVYESASTNKFFHGRTENIRSATTSSLQFIKAIQSNSSIGKGERRLLLESAAKKHLELAKNAVSGMGVDRHLTAMKYLATNEANSGKPMLDSKFYNDPLYVKSSTWECSTSNISNPFLSSFGFGPVVGNGYGCGYLIQEKSIPIVVTNFKTGNTDADAMAEGLNASFLAIRDIYTN